MKRRRRRTQEEEAAAEHDDATQAAAAGHGAEQEQEGQEQQRKKAKRERTVVDYEAFGGQGQGQQHLQAVWAQTLARVASTGNSTSVRVQVAKGLDAFFRKLQQHLASSSSLDPSEEELEARASKDRQLEVEEEHLSAEAKRLEEELRKLTEGNLQNRSQVRVIAAHGVELVDVERLLASVPRRAHADVVHANKEDGGDEETIELRKEASAAFAQFVGNAAALGDETTNAQREDKVGRLLTVWKQRAEVQTKGAAAARADKGTTVAARSKLVAALKD